MIQSINNRRLTNFKKNKRGYFSFIILTFLFVTSLLANIIANDKPIAVFFDGKIITPIITSYSEEYFGGDFKTEADYRDPYVKELINDKGWMIWPLIPFSYDTINYELKSPAPSPPDRKNWLESKGDLASINE